MKRWSRERRSIPRPAESHMLDSRTIEKLCERAIEEAGEASEPDPDEARDQAEDR